MLPYSPNPPDCQGMMYRISVMHLSIAKPHSSNAGLRKGFEVKMCPRVRNLNKQ